MLTGLSSAERDNGSEFPWNSALRQILMELAWSRTATNRAGKGWIDNCQTVIVYTYTRIYGIFTLSLIFDTDFETRGLYRERMDWHDTEQPELSSSSDEYSEDRKVGKSEAGLFTRALCSHSYFSCSSPIVNAES